MRTEAAPLHPSAARPPVRRGVLAVAAVSAVLAAVMVASAASQMGWGAARTATRASLLQALGAGSGAAGVRYYYLPASEAHALVAQQGLSAVATPSKLDAPHYTVYDTGGEEGKKASLAYFEHSFDDSSVDTRADQIPGAIRSGPPDLGAWGAGNHGLDPQWKCTVPNLIALYNFVQPEWAKCKENPNYVEPNYVEPDANATGAANGGAPAETASSPSTIGWLFKEVEGHDVTPSEIERARAYKAQAQRFVKHKLLSGPSALQNMEGYFGGSSSRRLLAQVRAQQLANWDTHPVNDTSAPTMKQCLDVALGQLCKMIDTCDDPVCDNYYNETEIEGLCGICEMRKGDNKGCFASRGLVSTQRGTVTVGDLRLGDWVESVSEGNVIWSRVIFLHDHQEPAATLALTVGERKEGAHRRMELTPQHLIHVRQSEGCSALVPARNVKVGDMVYVVEDGVVRVQRVLSVEMRRAKVRYVVTDNDMLVVDGVVTSVYSTGAGRWETMPFHLLHRLFPGVFAHRYCCVRVCCAAACVCVYVYTCIYRYRFCIRDLLLRVL
jgi:hypothetical protein